MYSNADINKLVNSNALSSPNAAPSKRLSHPSETASMALVSKRATKAKANGTAIQMSKKANICATVMDSVTVGQRNSANEA